MGKKVVIVGYGTAGSAAAAYIKLFCRDCDVTVIEKRPYPVYHPCSIPDCISGDIECEKLIEHEPLTKGIEFIASAEVDDVDTSNKVVYFTKEGSRHKMNYDYLILTTGSKPAVPRVLAHALEVDKVFTVKNIEDGIAIRKVALQSKEAIVIGAGAIGLEIATALKKLGLRVILIEALSKILPALLDDDVANYALEKIKAYGVEVVLNKPVVHVEKHGDKVKVQTKDGSEFVADFAVMAIGLRPNIDLAKKIGLKIGELGGVVVDEYMRTSIEGIYAAGDVVQVKHLITGKPTLGLFASTAFKEGRVAGLNVSGIEEKYPGTLIPWLVATEPINIGGVGLSYDQCVREGIKCTFTAVETLDVEPYEKVVNKVLMKLIVRSDDYRIVGAEVVSKANVARYVDMLTALIEAGKTVEDIVRLETVYQPKHAALLSPVFVAAEALYRRYLRIKRRKKS